MLACSGGSGLISIGLEVGKRPSNEVKVDSAIEGIDRDRSSDDSGRNKRQDKDRTRPVRFGPSKESDDAELKI